MPYVRCGTAAASLLKTLKKFTISKVYYSVKMWTAAKFAAGLLIVFGQALIDRAAYSAQVGSASDTLLP